MVINSNTKIAKILKQNPEALEAIISINPKFEKLRNPLLRKLMAARTSIGMASKIGGFDVEKFFEKLQPLGFEPDRKTAPETNKEKPKLPPFFNSIKPEQITDFDVRPLINEGKDPLTLIVDKVKSVPKGGVLKIINSFEPTPLISLLKKQGFESFVDTIDEQEVDTYFYKTSDAAVEINKEENNSEGWDELIKKFTDKMETVDVRQLEMPQPMMTILECIEKLPDDTALFVYHKRIPVFLLPELRERKFDYRIKEEAPNEVRLLIFKD
ncbi:MAG TPA: DUF2249 domain-containing protein [Hanamia sp.]|nr:DUF2249 domain-containing protein [Hanamia sp.]